MSTFRDPMIARRGTDRFDRPVLRAALLLIAILLGGCGGEVVRTSPEEILTTVKIPDPSVLGYVRADASGLQLLVGFLENLVESDPFRQARLLEERIGGVPGANLLFSSLPVDMMRKVVPLSDPGSHMTVVLLDPGIFGGGAALHFVPERGKSLVEVLEAAGDYQRVGDAPPEFRLVRSRHPFKIFLQALKQFDLDLEIPGDDYDLRFMVEESEEGTLVIPSFDARRDVVAFLESTEYLSPWGEAGLVIDLDMDRLAMAYADLIRSLDRSIRKIAAKLDDADDRRRPLTAGRILRFWSATVLGFLGSLDGVRYVSRLPDTGATELRVLAKEDSAVDRVLRVLRQDGPPMLGMIPGGLACQVNCDPEALAALVPEARDFYTEVCQMNEGELNRLASALVKSLEISAGSHLSGVDASSGGIMGASVSILEDGVDPSVKEERSYECWASFAQLFGRSLSPDPDREEGQTRRLDLFDGLFTVEEGVRGNKWVSTTVWDREQTAEGGGDGDRWSRRLFGLAQMGAPPPPGLPRKAHLFLKFRLMPVGDAALQAVGMLMNLGFSGHGRVDRHELIVVFT